MKYWIIISLLMSSGYAMADEFDITMDVVGAGESFDKAIVNHIALPFTRNAAPKINALLDAGSSASELNELGSVVSEGVGASSVERNVESPVLGVENLSMEGVQAIIPH